MPNENVQSLNEIHQGLTRKPQALIVDSSPFDRGYLANMLEQLGCDVISAIVRPEEVEMQLNQHNFDLCFFSVKQPFNEIECVRQAKRPVLYVEDTQDVAGMDLKSLGFVMLLPKPAKIEDLRRLLCEFNL